MYAIDVKLPGMLCAAIKDCPVFGGKLVSFDNAKIAAMPGVTRAVRVNDTTVAVVADTWWHAKKALDALPIVWDEGENATRTSAQIAEHLKEGLTAANAYAMRNEGDTLKAIDAAPVKVEAVYSTPFLAHATMEPMNCTVKITADRAEAGSRRRTARPRWRRSPSSPGCRSRNARSTSTSWAAASAGAAARRTTCGRRSTSASSFPASRSR